MAERRPDIDLRTNTNVPLHEDFNPTDEERQAFRARVAEVGDRGIVASRLSVDLPPELHGEWVDRLDTGRVSEYELMGFKVDNQYAMNNKLHNDGTGAPIIGDVIFMTIPKWKKDEWTREHLLQSKRNNPSSNAENALLAQGLRADGNTVQPIKGMEGSTETVEGLDNIQNLLNTQG